MSSLPPTITNPEAFLRSPAAGFDGIFNWEWVRGVFPRGIMPMDFDGVVELAGWFLTFESKDKGKKVPTGQALTLKRLPEMFVVFFIEGKQEPDRMRVMHNGEWVSRWFVGLDHCRAALVGFGRWMQNNPFPKLDSVQSNKVQIGTLTDSANAYWVSKGWA